MSGSSSRLFILFTGPLSLFNHRPSTLLRLTRRHSLTCPLRSISGVPRHLLPPNSPVLIKSSQQFHSQTTINALQENNHIPADDYLVPPSHPWPEWSNLLESITSAGYFAGNGSIKDEFVPNESLSMEFVDAASSCLGFALNRPDILGWLPKKDIQVLIEDGAPFLFKSAIETERRMRSFLQEEELNEATTVDLMKYILSYASNPIIYPERIIREATESSARNLLREMANFSRRWPASDVSAVEKFRGVGRDEQTPRNLGPNITMKRGDWICPKCNFMNFAKNTKCLECEESRPQRQLTGGEWDCPQCNFFNYGRNTACLKCECKRPGESPLPKTPSQRQLVNSQNQNKYGDNRTPNGDDFWTANKNPETSFDHNLDRFHSNPSTDPRTHNSKSTYGEQDARKNVRSSSYAPFVPLPDNMYAKKPEKTTIKDTAEEEKSERWFKKVSESQESAISDEDFPQIMPIRKGENRFVVSKKKDRSLTSPSYKQQQAIDQGSNSKFVPFVPFPPDYFTKKDVQQQLSENSSKATHDTNLAQQAKNQEKCNTDNSPKLSGASTHENNNSRSGWEGMSLEGSAVKETDPLDMSEEANAERWSHETNLVQQAKNQETCSTDNLSPKSSGASTHESNNNSRSRWEGTSLEGSAVKETDPLDMSEEAKAERWFRRVAQIKDISELSQIPDEDFPSIMPMRKGVNRFVVSKRKTPLERRLTSPQYRKNLRVVSSDPTKNEDDGS